MKTTTLFAAIAAAMMTATSASALSFLDNFGVGSEEIEEGTVRVDENGDPVVDTTRGNGSGNGNGNGKGRNR